MKLSKFVYVLILQGNYGAGWEDEAAYNLAVRDERREAREDLKAYRVESRFLSRLIRRRVLRHNYETGNF